MEVNSEKSIKVIFIDDGLHDYSALEKIISHKRDLTLIAHFTTGAEAIEKCILFKPDVVIIYAVPDIDKFELLDTLQSILKTTGFIMCTFSASPEFYNTAMQAGVRDFLPIPFFYEEQIYEAIYSAYELSKRKRNNSD